MIGFHLDPIQLLHQLIQSHEALKQVVTNPNTSVFFGVFNVREFWHKIMTDSFFVGILTYLLNHQSLTSVNDYITLFNSLNFQTSDWNFNQWIRSLSGGSNQNNSKAIVFKFFEKVFGDTQLPPNVNALDDFLRGNLASVTITYYALRQNGRPDPTTALVRDYIRGTITSETIHPRVFVKITSKTMNIGRIEVFDKRSPSYNPRTFNLISGVDISSLTPSNSNPLELKIKLFHYGGLESEIDLTLRW